MTQTQQPGLLTDPFKLDIRPWNASTFFGLEEFSYLKLVGLFMSMGGTVLVGLADQNSGTDTILGDSLCLFSAIM